MQARTLYDKLVDAHTVHRLDDTEGPGASVLLYVDRTVLNEYTSPQAFSGLRAAGRRVWRPEAALAVVDHVNPTAAERVAAMPDPGGARQVAYFDANCRDFGIELLDVLHPLQGIEHVVAPEQGFVLPGMIVAAGDSHTTTYGALGALGFGIGTSDIEHYLATQTLVYRRMKTLRVTVSGILAPGVTAKDVVMALIRRIGADGATGYALEFAGPAVEALSVEGRMTICNMAVECGARGVVMAPDRTVLDYLADKPRVPKGALWEAAAAHWLRLRSDDGAAFDREVALDAAAIEPMVTWGTSPDQAGPVNGRVPDPAAEPDPARRRDMVRALAYMDLVPGTPLTTIPIQRAFIGSCTNGRIEDLRAVAQMVEGQKVHANVSAMVVPGSGLVKQQAEAEGLDRILKAAGFDWREPGCSMCLGMNADRLSPNERCASTSNRNFEGRQGHRGRTHLVSPAMAAAAAVAGRFVDIREWRREA